MRLHAASLLLVACLTGCAARYDCKAVDGMAASPQVKAWLCEEMRKSPAPREPEGL